MFENTPVALQLIHDALLLFLIVGSLFTLFIGLLFIFLPGLGARLNQRMSHWVSMRRPSKPLEDLHYLEHPIYKKHSIFGLLIMAGAVYVLYQIGFHYHHQEMVHTAAQYLPQSWVADWLLTATLWFAVPAMLLIVLFGAALASRPSMLKRVEQRSNRWFSTRQWLLPLEKQHLIIDHLVQQHPRKFGLLVALVSGYSLFILLLIYFHKLT